jgi:type I restriction-modification system DNA methylase subunit
MARLASEAKAGFFATPEYEMELILRALQVDKGKEEASYFIFDPCCGQLR